jgi:glycosyltransferase involved in cell wall biosynthesis
MHSAGKFEPPIELSTVVIAFNEVECIVRVVAELSAALAHAGIAFELVLVDDGSQDGTADRMQELAVQDARVRVVSLVPNRGIGAALRAGFDAARGAFVCWVPADGQIAPEVVVSLFAQRARAPMLTTVYRNRDDAWYRHVLSGTLNRLILWRTGQAAKSGGNYLFARGAWEQHAPVQDDTMMLSTAFRQRLRQAGVPIVEVEIDARARVAGRSKVLNPRTILRTLQALLALRRSRR